MIIILIISALFVILFTGVEVAYSSYTKLHLNLESQKDLYYFSNKYFLPTIFIANILSIVVYTISFTTILSPLEDKNWISIIVEIIVISLSISIVSNLVARVAFSVSPLKILKLFKYIYYPVYFVLYIFTVIFSFVSKIILKLFNLNTSKDIKAFDKSDLLDLSQEIFESNQESGTDINTFFQRAVEFSELQLQDCILPFTDIVSVEKNIEINKLRDIFITSGISRILVYDDDKENIIGYVSSKDFIRNESDIYTILRAIEVVPETMPAQKQLNSFIKNKQTIALVADEFGNIIGMVSIEDIMEEIFGNIDDEYDIGNQQIKKINNNNYILAGKSEIDELNETYKIEIPELDEYKTIAGYIIYKLGRIPYAGEKFTIDKFSITILEASITKIDLVRLIKN